MIKYFTPLISLFFVPMRLDFLSLKNPTPAPDKKNKGYWSKGWNDDNLKYNKRTQSYVTDAVYNAPLKTTKKKGNFFSGKTGGLGKIFGKVLSKSKLTAPQAPQPAPQAPQPAPQAPQPAATPKAQAEAKIIYKNPANITTEYSPFGKPLAAIAPVVLPENYQEPKKASISTSGIAAIGAALLAGLL